MRGLSDHSPMSALNRMIDKAQQHTHSIMVRVPPELKDNPGIKIMVATNSLYHPRMEDHVMLEIDIDEIPPECLCAHIERGKTCYAGCYSFVANAQCQDEERVSKHAAAKKHKASAKGGMCFGWGKLFSGFGLVCMDEEADFGKHLN